jgi:hypothetical protein
MGYSAEGRFRFLACQNLLFQGVGLLILEFNETELKSKNLAIPSFRTSFFLHTRIKEERIIEV